MDNFKAYHTMAIYGKYQDGSEFYWGRYNQDTGKPDQLKYATKYYGNVAMINQIADVLSSITGLHIVPVPWWL